MSRPPLPLSIPLPQERFMVWLDPGMLSAIAGIVAGVTLTVAVYILFSPVELRPGGRHRAAPLPHHGTRRVWPDPRQHTGRAGVRLIDP